MLTKSRKVQILSSVAALLLLATLVACKGFFVNPTLQSITVTPSTPSVEVGKTVHMVATGTFDDNSTSTITSSVTWSTQSGNTDTISVGQSTGIVTGVALGTDSVVAASGNISSSTSVSVVPAGLVSIQVTPTNPVILSGATQPFQAIGTLQDTSTVDLTNVASWHSSNTDVATIGSDGVAQAQTVTTSSTTIITATSVGITSNQATLTVNP